jgi:glycosyltransferase involved in cell wall biosynthesis
MATNKRKQPKYQFCYVWTSHSEQIDKLYRLGIDHKGIVPEDDKFDIYSRAKVLLFPSIREGFGMAVVESLYAGLPVIA